MKDPAQQVRLRNFWGVTVFSLGIFWGCANLIYIPIAALTTISGSSWLEVFVIFAGGILALSVSVLAFYHRRAASIILLAGGVALLAVAGIGSRFFHSAGMTNYILLVLPGGIALLLGAFGAITERNGWPALRSNT